MLSVLKDAKPVDTLHANVVFQMAVCQLAIVRQSEFLLKPIRYELDADVAVALHRAAWDTSRMAPQRIKIDDQSVRLMGERMLTRLMQTYAMLLQVSAAYRKAAEADRQRAQKTAPARSSRGLNGSRQCRAHVNGSPKQQISSINVQKSNGHNDILLWNETSIWGGFVGQLSIPASTVTVSLASGSSGGVYDPTKESFPISTFSNVSQLQVSLGDSPLIIEIN